VRESSIEEVADDPASAVPWSCGCTGLSNARILAATAKRRRNLLGGQADWAQSRGATRLTLGLSRGHFMLATVQWTLPPLALERLPAR
jgi:hypothetical protein